MLNICVGVPPNVRDDKCYWSLPESVNIGFLSVLPRKVQVRRLDVERAN